MYDRNFLKSYLAYFFTKNVLTKFTMFKKKSSFKGKGKTLNDPAPQKPPPKAVSSPPKSEPVNAPQKPLELAGPPPGPDNRQTKISSRDAYKASDTLNQIKEDDDDYKLSKVDVKGMRVGADVQPKTFADVNKPKSKPPPTTANIKFNILVKKQIYTVEAKFATSEPLENLYTYLEKEVFSSVSNLEIRNSYPQTVIPRDPNKPLASLKLRGQVMLQVSASDAKLK